MSFSLIFENNLIIVLPELFLTLAIIMLLIFGSVLATKTVPVVNVKAERVSESIKNKLRKPSVINSISWLSIFSLFIGAILILNTPIQTALLFNNVRIQDPRTIGAKFVICCTAGRSLLISLSYFKYEQIHIFEYTSLVLRSVLGIMFLVSSNTLLILYLAIELQSLSFYVIAAFRRNNVFSTEAGLKYFILGAISSGFLLLGISLIYGFTGTRSFTEVSYLLLGAETVDFGLSRGIILIAIGLLFKSIAAPFHGWGPDVYEGSPTPTTTFFAIVPKLALFAVFMRLFIISFYDIMPIWQSLLLICAVLSIVVSALAALYQRRIKRFLAFSSIGHVGYILLGFATGTVQGVQGVFVYLIIYVIISLNAWTFVLAVEQGAKGRAKFITDFGSLFASNPLLAISFSTVILSMAGIPPLAGFAAKIYIFFAAIESGLYFVAIFGVRTSVIGAFYYLRILKIIYFEKNPSWVTFKTIDAPKAYVLATTTLLIFVLLLNPAYLLSFTKVIALSLFI